MKYKLITDNSRVSIFDKIVENRKIENKLEDIITPKQNYIVDKYKLKNLNKAVEKLIEHISKGSKIGLIWDCDCDGFTSGAIIHNYLTKRFEDKLNLVDYFHTGKEHGISSDIKLDSDLNLLIVVDGGSNDYEQHKALQDRGTEVLVLDHHLCSKESEDAIVVNNQMSPEYDNKHLSGVGICFKFCEAIDDYIGLDDNLAQYYLDLVAIGNIGDMMDLQSMETRYYAHEGIRNINNKLLKALIKKQEFSMNGKVNYHTIAFYIVPLINAMIREGKQAEKILMAEAFMDITKEVPYKKRGATEVTMVDFAEDVARLMGNAKSRQDAKVKKAYAIVVEQITKNRLDENKVIVVNATDIVDSSFTGLVANKLLSAYRRPVLLLKEDKRNEDDFGGSGRGYGISNFKKECEDSKLFHLAEGHENAFGIGIKKDDIKVVINHFNKRFEDVIFEIEHEIDLELNVKEVNTNDIAIVGELEDIWGSTLKEPLFLIKGIIVKDNEITKSDNRMKIASFRHKNLYFSKKYCSEELFDAMRNKQAYQFGSKMIEIDVIGKFKLNKIGDRIMPYIEIVDFESRDYLDLVF